MRERLDWLLAGRAPYSWGLDVRLSRGTVGRLLKGNLPDPVKLVPAMHAERLSLTWLVDGLGSPFLVNAPAHDHDAAFLLQLILKDEPEAWEIYLPWSPEGFCVVLSQPAERLDETGEPFRYRQAEVIGGAACGPETVGLVLGDVNVRHLEMSPSAWRRLVSGYMGNAELFGTDKAPGLVSASSFAAAKPLPAPLHTAVHNEAREAPASYVSDDEAEAMSILRSCTPATRAVIMRMLRGL